MISSKFQFYVLNFMILCGKCYDSICIRCKRTRRRRSSRSLGRAPAPRARSSAPCCCCSLSLTHTHSLSLSLSPSSLSDTHSTQVTRHGAPAGVLALHRSSPNDQVRLLCAALLERIGVYPSVDFAGLGSLAARIAPGAAYAQQVNLRKNINENDYTIGPY